MAKGCNWCEHGPTGKAGCHTTKQTEHMPAAFTCKADKEVSVASQTCDNDRVKPE